MYRQKHLALVLVLLVFSSFHYILAQSVWDGGGDGTSWNDPLNWNTDVAPALGAEVVFNRSATVILSGTGTALPPAKLTITGPTTRVDFDMDLDIGDPVSTTPALVVTNGGILNLKPERTLILDPPVTENAVQMNLAAGLNIEAGATLLVLKANRGINIAQRTALLDNKGLISLFNCNNHAIFLAEETGLVNYGEISITAPLRNGIYNVGSIVNLSGNITINSPLNRGIQHIPGTIIPSSFTNTGTGTITISSPGDDGIRSSAAFLNDTLATITVTQAIDDGIELIGDVFTNHGTINLTCRDAAITSGPGLAVGTNSVAATFINTSNNSLNVFAGSGGSGVSIYVYGMGVLSNSGTIDVSGGSPTLNIFNRGSLTNQMGGTIKLDDSRLTNNQGTFINNGLLMSGYGMTGAGVATTNGGTSTNNAFYDYGQVRNFSTVGAGATVNDFGADLQNTADITIDFGGDCEGTVPTNIMYIWTSEGNLVDTNDVMGTIVAMPGSIGPSLKISPTVFPTVELMVMNICAAALPVELMNFTAKPTDRTVLLEWATASELNNDFIAVERSIDAKQFKEIGRRAGAIESQEIRYYDLEDRAPEKGINYYRLRQVDVDGTTSFSEIVSVVFDGESNTVLTPRLYPNLVQAGSSVQLNLEDFPAGERVLLTITDLHGRSIPLAPLVGGSSSSYSLPELPAGTYVLRAVNFPTFSTFRFMVLD